MTEAKNNELDDLELLTKALEEARESGEEGVINEERISLADLLGKEEAEVPNFHTRSTKEWRREPVVVREANAA